MSPLIGTHLSVWKFEIPIDDYVELQMPKGAKLLAFQTQNEVPCLWALVDPAAEIQKRRFRFAGTGHLISNRPASLEYVGTCQMRGGAFVWHLFEITV